MSEYEQPYNPEPKFNESPEWYFDDDAVGELYEMMNKKEVPRDELKNLLQQVQSEFHNLDSRTDKTREEEDKLKMLNNIANQLLIEVGFDHVDKRQNPESPIELDGVH